MTDDVRFGGLVIGSRAPDELAAWYRTAFAPDDELGDILGRPVVTVGGAQLVFDGREDVEAGTAEPGRMQIDLYVNDRAAVERRLDPLDVTWIRPHETTPGLGSIATLQDPDGNYVQLLYPAEG